MCISCSLTFLKSSCKCHHLRYTFAQQPSTPLIFYPLPYWFFFILFLQRGEKMEKKRERNIAVRQKHQSIAFQTCPNQGPNPQPRYVPWPEIEPMTFCSAGWCPTNWATPIWANSLLFKGLTLYSPNTHFPSFPICFFFPIHFQVRRMSITGVTDKLTNRK